MLKNKGILIVSIILVNLFSKFNTNAMQNKNIKKSLTNNQLKFNYESLTHEKDSLSNSSQFNSENEDKNPQEIKNNNLDFEKKTQEINKLIKNDNQRLQEIENNYSNEDINNIKKYENVFHEIKTNIKKYEEFANIYQNKILENKILIMQLKINTLLRENEKKINEIKNKIISKNKSLDKIRINIYRSKNENKIENSEIEDLNKEINSVESFIEKYSEFAQKTENKDISEKLKRLNENLNFTIEYLAIHQKIQHYDEVIVICNNTLQNIEKNYKNYDIDMIENSQKTLTKMKTTIENIKNSKIETKDIGNTLRKKVENLKEKIIKIENRIKSVEIFLKERNNELIKLKK